MIDVIGIVKIKDIGNTYCVSRSPCRSLPDKFPAPIATVFVHHLRRPHCIFAHSNMNATPQHQRPTPLGPPRNIHYHRQSRLLLRPPPLHIPRLRVPWIPRSFNQRFSPFTKPFVKGLNAVAAVADQCHCPRPLRLSLSSIPEPAAVFHYLCPSRRTADIQRMSWLLLSVCPSTSTANGQR